MVALAVPLVGLALLTHQQVGSLVVAGRSDAVAGPDASGPRLAFGSVTADGAILFRVGQPVHARATTPDGVTTWERDFTSGEYLVCGPCPGAVIRHDDGTVSAIEAGGAPVAPPPQLGPHLLSTTSPVGVVLAAAEASGHPAGQVTFFTPTSTGLVESGASARARLDQPLVAVTPAWDGSAVTIMQASADALHQGEFELVHVTPTGQSAETVALDPPGSRPLPCAVADGSTVAYLLVGGGLGADGSTRVVVRRDGAPPIDTTVPGAFDRCAAGPAGVVMASAANGEDGDLSRTVVRERWLAADGTAVAEATESIDATTASVALDPPRLRVAVAGGNSGVVVADGHRRVVSTPARAVAFDDRGGLWRADASERVSREGPG